MNKEDGRKLSPEVQEAIRLRVVSFIKSGMGTQKQAAEVFQISLSAVKKIWRLYKESGLKALRAKKRGPHNSPALLSKAQKEEVTRCIKKGMPDNYGIPYFLWTADAVRRLIKKKPG